MTAIETLRKAAKGSEDFDEKRARSEIEAAISSYNAAAIHALTHEDQAKPREAEKALEPILGNLKKLLERLDDMEPERWQDWQWIAAGA